jgi:hypothetical protein
MKTSLHQRVKLLYQALRKFVRSNLLTTAVITILSSLVLISFSALEISKTHELKAVVFVTASLPISLVSWLLLLIAIHDYISTEKAMQLEL